MQRTEDRSDVTGFGSFDNSTCKRVLDLLEPGDLRLGQVVIKRCSAATEIVFTSSLRTASRLKMSVFCSTSLKLINSTANCVLAVVLTVWTKAKLFTYLSLR